MFYLVIKIYYFNLIMNKFNKIEVKNRETRNEINDRMQGFYVPNRIEPQESKINNFKEMNSKLINRTPEIKNDFDRKSFKNDINQRMNDISGDSLFYKRLPMNNNIRDYNITMDSNKDEFNNRLMNYNRLASNITATPNEENKMTNLGFHNNFKDDTNKRLEELSPLSCNVGYPVTKPNKLPDFNQNLPESNFQYSENKYSSLNESQTPKNNIPLCNDSFSSFSNYENFEVSNIVNKNVNNLEELNYKRPLSADTKQNFFFSNK